MSFAQLLKRELAERWRRRSLIAVLLAVASLVACCFMSSSPRLNSSSRISSKDGSVTRLRSLTSTMYCMRIVGLGSQPQPPADPVAAIAHMKSLPFDSRVPDCILFPPDARMLNWFFEERGFPLRCVSGWSCDDGDSGGCITRTASTRYGAVTEHIPIRPQPFAAAADLGIFAIAWNLALCVPVVARARARSRQGKCPKCRYDLLGNLAGGCPECGWNKEGRTPA